MRGDRESEQRESTKMSFQCLSLKRKRIQRLQQLFHNDRNKICCQFITGGHVSLTEVLRKQSGNRAIPFGWSPTLEEALTRGQSPPSFLDMLFHCLTRGVCLMLSLCKGNIAIYGSTATCCTLFSYLRGTSLIKRHRRARAVASLNCAFKCPEKLHPALASSPPNHSFTICLPPPHLPPPSSEAQQDQSTAQLKPRHVCQRGGGGWGWWWLN